jgi:inorganic phosphate transporter, PiT family
MVLFFLSSGLFLGWSLGANDAANVFGTAVGTRMVRFKTAALVCSVFVVLGAVIGGAGASHTLGKLGAVDAVAGSFMVALSAAVTVFLMTKMRLPVSTSQAIVGAIIGWNFFSGSITDSASLVKIMMTWVACPVLAALLGMFLYRLFDVFERKAGLHLFRMDSLTRFGLLAVGAFGSYSLGANNIANVVGVFIPVVPFTTLDFGLFTLTGVQQLFLLGSLAIAVGVYTYSERVMGTVGNSLLRLSPQMALVVVLAQSLVLFLFSSTALEAWLLSHGLPAIPLVPVSSSQAVVGAVIGVALVRGGKGIKYGVLGEISTGWVTTPIIAGVVTFVALFFLQNVFGQQVFQPKTFKPDVLVQQSCGLLPGALEDLPQEDYNRAITLQQDLRRWTDLTDQENEQVVEAALVEHLLVRSHLVSEFDQEWFSSEQMHAIETLESKRFTHAWQLFTALENLDPAWSFREKTALNKSFNKKLKQQRDRLRVIFQDRKPLKDEVSLP